MLQITIKGILLFALFDLQRKNAWNYEILSKMILIPLEIIGLM